MMKSLNYRHYGFALSLSHLLTLLFWQVFDASYGLQEKLSFNLNNPWPFMPNTYQSWVQNNASFVIGVYVGLSFVTPLLFLVSKIPFSLARTFFALTFVSKLTIYLSSYDFMGNYHYMANLIMLAYILSPKNIFSFKVIVALFYLGAGLIKLNWEWLSGSALLKQTFIEGPLLVAACAYVIILEIFLVWGLFSERKTWRYIVLFQLVVFHLFSWHIVGFYYPLTMLLIISVFLIPTEKISIKGFFTNSANTPLILYSLFFLMGQAYPKILNKEESLTAEGRMFSLNMLDAKAECLVSFEIPHENGFLYLDNPTSYATRIRCDPLTWFNYGRELCSSEKSIYLRIISKKTSEEKFRTVVDKLDVCSPKLSYSIFKNDWVLSRPDLRASSISISTNRNWRYDNQRTGQSLASLSLELSSGFQSAPLQLGIHGAAKSSAYLLPDQTVIVPSDSGVIWAFKNNQLLWKNYYPHSGHGFHSSPAIINDQYILIGSYDGVLQLLDSKNGQRIWATKVADAIGASPLIMGESVFISTETLPNISHVVQLDLRNGQVLRRNGPFSGLAHASLAASQDRKSLYGATNSGTLFAVSITENKIEWQHQISKRIVATPVVTETSVWYWTTEGVLIEVDPNSGEKKWELALPNGGRSSPTWDHENQFIFVTSEDGQLYAIDTNNKRIKWQKTTDSGHITSGSIANTTSHGRVYWDRCKQGILCALDIQNGKPLKEYILGGDFTSSPLIQNNKLLISLDGPMGYWIFQSDK